MRDSTFSKSKINIMIRKIYLLFAVFFMSISFLTFYNVSLPLFSDYETEVDKLQHFDYSVGRATEYDELKKPFWWLEMGQNFVTVINRGNEVIIGIVALDLTPNPCKSSRAVRISY